MKEKNLGFIKNCENGVILNIHLTPNASKNEIIGYTDNYIKIRVSAPPNDNKANKKLVEFISDTFNIGKSYVSFISGEKSRVKKILIKNIIFDDVIKNICLYDKILS